MGNKNILRRGFTAALLAGLVSSWAAQAAEIIPVGTTGSSSNAVLGSTVIPYKEVTLSAQIPGVVKYVAGAVGTSLPQGGVVFQVDDSQLRAKRSAVVAQISQAQAGVTNAQSQYYRELASPRSKDVGAMPGFAMPSMFDQLAVRPFAKSFMGNYDSDAIRQADLSNATANVSQAQSQLQQANAQLQEIDASLRDASAYAPFEGIIMEKMVEVGDTVQPGQPLVKFGYVKYKRLQADVPAGLVGSLKQDMLVPARIDGSTHTSVRVSEIYPVADASRHTVTVKFDIPMEISTAPGMYAEIYLPESKRGDSQVITVPNSALLKGSSLPAVLVVKADNTSELRMVRLGSSQGDDRVEIVSGLTAGERIIDSPPVGVSSGWMPPESRSAATPDATNSGDNNASHK
ncbi:efflux RND transporter periplasmic adaptor subunit [Thiothrix nivea]|uniref:Efflux transporter, RND family, MFP subunit n=1 Tax=Thiothrix nivea (strain ATCC 35100 / DSM 5205 / JP2) TaxID=870187 RepID=A0A656HAB3_THINJ|nr:efflux RND transporter periplasmic adaptor subunit [Thiothrix nivea]EIJ32774.1 efflux transporter, RND family, MFP subunit [Thiothrix nivea DSM 5205]